MSFNDVPSNSYVGRGNKIVLLLLYSPAFLPSMRGIPVTNQVHAVYLFIYLFISLLKITEIFHNTSTDENSTKRPHDYNIQSFNHNLNGS